MADTANGQRGHHVTRRAMKASKNVNAAAPTPRRQTLEKIAQSYDHLLKQEHAKLPNVVRKFFDF